MTRFLTLTLLMASTLLASLGCGDDCKGLCGSICDLRACDYNKITCYGNWDGEGDSRHIKDLKVYYQQCGSPSSCIFAAILVFEDLLGIDPVNGHCFEGESEMLAHVLIQAGADGEPWPAFEGNRCCISKGGETAGETFAGKCGFLFDNGRTLTAPWSCELEDPLAEE